VRVLRFETVEAVLREDRLLTKTALTMRAELERVFGVDAVAAQKTAIPLAARNSQTTTSDD
jgi:hypothetical protein